MLKEYKEADVKNYLQVFSTVSNAVLPQKFFTTSTEELDAIVDNAEKAFLVYKRLSPAVRAHFLETIAEEIMLLGDELIQCAMQETALPEARLVGERGRTTSQLKLFADVLKEGTWVEAVIDTALPDRKPLPRADIRKMLVPLGPVAVFGAANFPFAFSTAGGDTASALAAGNPVIVKAHESHLGTNVLMAKAITAAVKKCGLPEGLFSYVVGPGPATGMQLVKHSGIKAVGFTGSYTAGMAILRAAATERQFPIPVYAEMSSINPVLLLNEKLAKDADAVAAALSGSITLGAGQFCTNPGLLFLLDNNVSEKFINKLVNLLAAAVPGVMLNPAICDNYYKSKRKITLNSTVKILFEGDEMAGTYKGSPALLQVNANDFIDNLDLQHEVFGPSSLIVTCKDDDELQKAIASLQGQLTATVFGTNDDIKKYSSCIGELINKVGRVIYNSVPTGVEVCHAMVHGGPFPATTDSRSTSVGVDAIKRFARPVCFQDCANEFLPDELKNENTLNIMRKINGDYTRDLIC